MDNKEFDNLNDSKKTKNITKIVIMSGLVLLVGAFSYAFWPTETSPNVEQYAEGSTAELKLRYTDCSSTNQSDCEDITRDLEPGDSLTKTFQIENIGTKDVTYDIYFRQVKNTFIKEELVYKLENLTTGEVIKNNTPVPHENSRNEPLMESLTSKVGETIQYRLTITFLNTDYEQYDNSDAEFLIKLGIMDSRANSTATFAKTLIAKSNNRDVTSYTDGVQTEMYTFSHEATEQTPAQTDYRYIGANPNNYIIFNDETWRIIGVFPVKNVSMGEYENRIKIMRSEKIGNIAWNSSSTNEWIGGEAETNLNGDYFNRVGDYASIGLNEIARSQISKITWHLGGSTNSSSGPTFYKDERSLTTCVTSGNCSGEIRSTSVEQSVGLIYPSDYIYTYSLGVDDSCYVAGNRCHSESGEPLAGWMRKDIIGKEYYTWTISPSTSNSGNVLFLDTNDAVTDTKGTVTENHNASDTKGIIPVVYLRTDIDVVSGNGSAENPYQIN